MMQYTVTSSLLKYFKTKGDSTHCARCGESFKDGDLVVSRPSGHRYHTRCFEKMYVDLED
jgi:hypothetical protein